MRPVFASSGEHLTVSALLCAALLVGGSMAVAPQPAAAQAKVAASGDGPAWTSLTPAQKSVLGPLARDWNQLEPARRVKWIEIADRFPRLPAAEQARIKERMTTWARMTPTERGRARQNYQDAQQLSPEERKARWEAYNALPADRRQELAQKGSQPSGPRDKKRDVNRPSGDRPTAKSSIVPGVPEGARPKPVAPTVTQARPGATTNPISKKATPPVHQQAGQPKIAATPGFVDNSTLLPKRGPQGAGAQQKPQKP